MDILLKTLKNFYLLLTRRRGWFFVFIFITLTSNLLNAVQPYFYKLFADAIQLERYDNLAVLLAFMIAIRFLALMSHMLSFYTGDILIFDAVINLRTKVFKHLQDLDFAFHTQKSTGSLISAIKRGDGAMWSMFHSIHHRFLEVIIRFGVMMYFLSIVDFRITLITILSFVTALVATKYLVSINMRARRKHNQEEDKISGIIVDNLVNFETVKLFAREDYELKRLGNAYKPWLKYGWDYVNTFRLIDGSIGSIINISVFFILLITLTLTRSMELTIGEFLLVLGFVNSVYPSLWELIYGFREIGKSFTDVEKYFSILENKIEIKDPVEPITMVNVKGEIDFNNVSFSYKDGKKNAIKNLTLKIRQGQSVALVGRSGSGKTTLVKLLMRFYDVDMGSIAVDGLEINNFTKSHLRSFMGVVPQEPVLFDNTVAYNIAYGKENSSQKEVVAAAKMANLHSFIVSLPKKYNTNVGERGIKLSGGQKQRLAIARMILSQPEIVIFDEATSQLDSENEALIQDAFWKAVKGKTAIIIAHRLSTALRADKIVVMENGKIVEAGPHGALLRNKDSLYKYFWDLQTNNVQEA